MGKAAHEDCFKAMKPSEGSLHVSSVCLQKTTLVPQKPRLPPCSWRLTRGKVIRWTGHIGRHVSKVLILKRTKGPFFPVMVL